MDSFDKYSVNLVSLFLKRSNFMAETIKPSQTQKPTSSETPRPLTRPEIESLRQNRQKDHIWAQKAIKKIKRSR